jgi:flavin-dependent dehydrogenase
VGRSIALQDGAEIAVIGGGPAGSLFSIFALKLAYFIGKNLNITIYEPKDFKKQGPSGCNHCGGIISEILVQMLAVEGINLPETVVQRGINSYRLHTAHGSATIETPARDKTIATVYRGGGPRGLDGNLKDSFDDFLISLAEENGAKVNRIRVDEIKLSGGKPALLSAKATLQKADLVVGAFGVNSKSWSLFENLGFGYNPPRLQTTAIAEISLDEQDMRERLGNSIHLFLLPVRHLKFAALIPKTTYFTLCILGSKISADTVPAFLEQPSVRKVLGDASYSICCRCLPKMNMRAPAHPFSDRIVAIGDAGSTRLLKDGLGAAYYLGKAAAKSAVLHGVGCEEWAEHYLPAYRSLIIDNRYGELLYLFTELFKRVPLLTKGMLGVVRQEQGEGQNPKILSSILWDMFTGNERFKRIFPRGFSLRMHRDLLLELEKILVS